MFMLQTLFQLILMWPMGLLIALKWIQTQLMAQILFQLTLMWLMVLTHRKYMIMNMLLFPELT